MCVPVCICQCMRDKLCLTVCKIEGMFECQYECVSTFVREKVCVSVSEIQSVCLCVSVFVSENVLLVCERKALARVCASVCMCQCM